MGVAPVSPLGVRITLCGKLLLPAVCILFTASCQKHTAAPFPVLSPPRASTADRSAPPLETPPSLSVGEPTLVNPRPVVANAGTSLSTGTTRSTSRHRPSATPNSQAQP